MNIYILDTIVIVLGGENLTLAIYKLYKGDIRYENKNKKYI